MSIPVNKEELLQAIITNYSKLKQDLNTISPEFAEIKELEGHSRGTLMSVNDLLAYLIGWGELIIKWNHKKDNNEPVDFPETGFSWNELGKLAQKFYEDYKDENFPGLVQRLDKTVEYILYLIKNKTNEELYGKDWYGKWTLGRMIQLNTASPYANAGKRIRKWKKGLSLK
ncbi:ClbS/DfsB family four-helix bundle protein [uncultured Chryseobacterium sp.]|uniref:ClbS/DfsB family four-helix bundle protein n=1 Tax=uncultured Chryseobacterium sp. TaxID=259322 RepID=UPI002612D8B5|nr:ClbS/DfsB family four-helix bundle protein [uncultured Chryseobacterium sp.]